MFRFFRKSHAARQEQQIPGAETAYAISPEGRAALHPDGVVLFHVGRGLIFTANRTGARIWRGLLDHHGLTEIAADLSREYGVPSEQAERDTAGFLADLEAEGLLTRVAGLRR